MKSQTQIFAIQQHPLPLPDAVALLFSILTWPVWRWLWAEWMTNDYYSHGILIVPVALFLAWRRLSNDRIAYSVSPQVDWRSLLFLAVTLLLYLYWLNTKAYYLAAFVAVGLIAGLTWVVGSLGHLRRLMFPISYLFLMIPVPFVERATLPLALFTGVCSGALVKFLGLDISIVGNAIRLPNADLVIGAQCSGINSMITLFALTALCGYILHGPLWGRLTLVILAIPIAMLGNILRVSNLLVVARYWGAEAAFRFYHDYSGIVFFLLVLALLLPLTKLLGCRTLRLEVL
jgi:exosortase